MAKVILHPIGTPLEDAISEKAYAENARRMQELNERAPPSAGPLVV